MLIGLLLHYRNRRGGLTDPDITPCTRHDLNIFQVYIGLRVLKMER